MFTTYNNKLPWYAGVQGKGNNEKRQRAEVEVCQMANTAPANSPRNGLKELPNDTNSLSVNSDKDWDVWLPMLPHLEEPPWSLQDVAKVLRLGRARYSSPISPQAIERVSCLLQRPLLRIVQEAKRLSIRYSRCSKQEIQTSIRLVLSLSMARTCLMLASKAFSLYSMTSDKFARSKKSRSGLVFPVGKIFRWLVEMKVGARIYDVAAIYLAATLEFIAEELVFRAVTNLEGFEHVTPEVIEEWVNLDPDLWGMLQPYSHLLSGQTVYGIADSLEIYGAPKKGQPETPDMASRRDKGLEKCFSTTCVTSVTELADMISQAQRKFADVYQSKENRILSQVTWAPSSVRGMFYYLKRSHQVDEDLSDTLSANRRSHSHVPPLVEWMRVASIHAEHGATGIVDDDDVRQAARILMPFNDCQPRSFGPDDSVSSSRNLSPSTATISFQQDMGLRMLTCGRKDILPQALIALGPEKVNTINIQGMTPLMYACSIGSSSLVISLTENHALLDTQVSGDTKRYPLATPDTRSWTALTFAAMASHVFVCQLLLDAGANPDGSAEPGHDSPTETPLQLASASGNYDLVSLLLRKNADPYINLTSPLLGQGNRGCGSLSNAFSAAAAHGHRNVLRKLLAQPNSRRDSDILSLHEILSEGYSAENQKKKLGKKRTKVLQEALYHSCEHGYLDIAMEIRSLGVPWNIHCWTQTLLCAYEKSHKSFIRCLLRDFQSIPLEQCTADFCDDGLLALFNVFNECEDFGFTRELAAIISACFGEEHPAKITELSTVSPAIRIGPNYINNPEMSDVTFLVEEKPFYAHKIILATATKRFKVMLSPNTSNSPEGKIPCIEINNIKYEIFQLVIQHLYTGKIDTLKDHTTMLELLHASHYFMLDGLRRHCEVLGSQMLNPENALQTYSCAKRYEAGELQRFCEEFLLLNLPIMTESKVFRDVPFAQTGKELLSALQSTLIRRIKSREKKA